MLSNQRMDESPLPLRRVLLAHLVTGCFLLPDWMRAALAAPPTAVPVLGTPAPASSRPAALPLVMLDPGHGGKDPGAIGVSGTHEKKIVLSAALELRRQLLASGRYRVEMTRSRDVFVRLEERVARAQSRRAALFVSIHADAVPDRFVRGASVYTLANTASDAQTAALARRENSADRFGTPTFRDVPPNVGRILASLVRQETRLGSARIAQALVRDLDRDVKLLTNPSRHASFMVLKSADIPSVLVEMGFMSNPDDEAALRRLEHRTRVAAAIKRSVDGYFAAANYMARMAG
ncbi:MAG: N-acetylmuramoyl-L-alanine amidase [Acetobacteraceae bacterium]|nr:N-acetylmuramoyl-L-alanine amidase [Acetobacteraceae bacterium]MSP28869.1 N-acetylmuramoyl-L-alanine amidase [Acetobacteraceae bacterium]